MNRLKELVETWHALIEASIKLEATANRAGKTARRITEEMRVSTAALRAENNKTGDN